MAKNRRIVCFWGFRREKVDFDVRERGLVISGIQRRVRKEASRPLCVEYSLHIKGKHKGLVKKELRKGYFP